MVECPNFKPAIWVTIALLLACVVPAAARAGSPNGHNVEQLTYDEGNGRAGNFRQTGKRSWRETNSRGERFDFEETNRDDWSVYLNDASRGIRVQLDLHRKMVSINGNDAYAITSASAGGGGGGKRDDLERQQQLEAEKQRKSGQRDAEQRREEKQQQELQQLRQREEAEARKRQELEEQRRVQQQRDAEQREVKQREAEQRREVEKQQELQQRRQREETEARKRQELEEQRRVQQQRDAEQREVKQREAEQRREEKQQQELQQRREQEERKARERQELEEQQRVQQQREREQRAAKERLDADERPRREAERPPAALGAKGFDASSIVYDEGGGRSGRFQQVGDAAWRETNSQGQTFDFQETQRDEWSVYLHDASRNLRVQLDLFRRKVGIDGNDAYAVTAAGAERFVPASEPEPEPSPSPAQLGANGRNATRVVYDAGGGRSGRFEQIRSDAWRETGSGGGSFEFRETQRDDWTVYLHDDSRNVDAKLNLHRRKVIIDGDDFYDVTAATADRFVPEVAPLGANGRNATRVVYDAGGGRSGRFEQIRSDAWRETGSGGASSEFQQNQRDEWSVYLHDASRNVGVQLDLHRRKVLIDGTDHYEVTAATADPFVAEVAPPDPAPPLPPGFDATVQTVTSVDFGVGGDLRGEYRQLGARQWEEVSASNTDRNLFEETGRDASSVQLYDRSRDVRLALDLSRRKVLYAQGRGQLTDLYEILGASAEPVSNAADALGISAKTMLALVEWGVAEVGRQESPACWKHVQDNVGEPTEPVCTDNRERVAVNQCFDRCRPGYHGGTGLKVASCFADCPPGSETIMNSCRFPLRTRGEACPPPLRGSKPKCEADSYERGGPFERGCPAGQERVDGRVQCFPLCPDGYQNRGPKCRNECGGAHPFECYTMCAKGFPECNDANQDIGNAVGDVVASIAVTVVTAGTATPMISAAKSAAKTGSKLAAKALVKQAVRSARKAITNQLNKSIKTRIREYAMRQAQPSALAERFANEVVDRIADTIALAEIAKDPDLREIVDVIDPTGIAALHTAFKKPSCKPEAMPL